MSSFPTRIGANSLIYFLTPNAFERQRFHVYLHNGKEASSFVEVIVRLTINSHADKGHIYPNQCHVAGRWEEGCKGFEFHCVLYLSCIQQNIIFKL